jgi:Endosomal/lysosomal potassium channel TMEM175
VLAPQLTMYMMSFLTVGIFWIGQQTQLNHLSRAQRSLAWMHLLFLFAVTLRTLRLSHRPTRLLVQHPPARPLVPSHLDLRRETPPPQVSQAIKRRIIIGQSLYAFGAALCIINTHWSIAFIVAVELYYAIGPRFAKHQRS